VDDRFKPPPPKDRLILLLATMMESGLRLKEIAKRINVGERRTMVMLAELKDAGLVKHVPSLGGWSLDNERMFENVKPQR